MTSFREQLTNNRIADTASARSTVTNDETRTTSAQKLLSPQDFYRALVSRPDVKKIMERLAK